MVIGNTKKVLFKIIPYEYRRLELYLEKMALKGWKFEYIEGEEEQCLSLMRNM
ncbi:hypothetical protein H8S20_16535 [Clostridium sp. NSJ-6]|uniref:DUF4177 domain-containing protein n=1 Tax=Clostridium hominis TaxID=2763036 RepID=A0ABR7DHZ6_9CLOT|nr:hypothetical protein [Clostridium hominis]MBC5630468.1 hypothetical protein [Clostridium hominis]